MRMDPRKIYQQQIKAWQARYKQAVARRNAVLKKLVSARLKALRAQLRALEKQRNPQPRVPPNRPRPQPDPPAPRPGPPVGGNDPGKKGIRPANNTTCDVYYGANAPPAQGDLQGVPCSLMPDFRIGSEASEADQDFRWTHVMMVDAIYDIRDNYPGNPTHSVYIPDRTGIGYEVVFVELVNRSQGGGFKRVYLDRKAVTWPADL